MKEDRYELLDDAKGVNTKWFNKGSIKTESEWRALGFDTDNGISFKKVEYPLISKNK